MGGSVKNFVSNPVKAIGDVVSNPLQLGASIVNPLTLGSTLIGAHTTQRNVNTLNDVVKGIGGGQTAPTVGGAQNPLQILTQSGGAPLLTNIVLGADVGTALMGYFGASGNFDSWLASLNPEDKQAVQGLYNQLSEVQTNTNMRNQAVQQLTADFPNIMQNGIQKYGAMADDVTKGLMDQAMQQISAKQAAGGNFSSGATAQAAANAGANIGLQKLGFASNLALQDFNNQYSNASALQTFQQKMLGQGANQGFNAIQNALSGNRQTSQLQSYLNYNANAANQQAEAGMYGALGTLGGTVLGGMFGGPAGAAIGGGLGGTLGKYSFGSSPSPMGNYGYSYQGGSGGSFGYNPMGSSPRLNVSGY